MDIYAPQGTKVRVDNHNKIAVRWGSNDDPSLYLDIGKEYTVDHTEVHSQHTKVILMEFPTKKFNSSHFD